MSEQPEEKPKRQKLTEEEKKQRRRARRKARRERLKAEGKLPNKKKSDGSATKKAKSKTKKFKSCLVGVGSKSLGKKHTIDRVDYNMYTCCRCGAEVVRVPGGVIRVDGGDCTPPPEFFEQTRTKPLDSSN